MCVVWRDNMRVESRAVTIAVTTATRIVLTVREQNQDSGLLPELVGGVRLSSGVSVASSDTFSYKTLLLLNRMTPIAVNPEKYWDM